MPEICLKTYCKAVSTFFYMGYSSRRDSERVEVGYCHTNTQKKDRNAESEAIGPSVSPLNSTGSWRISSRKKSYETSSPEAI